MDQNRNAEPDETTYARLAVNLKGPNMTNADRDVIRTIVPAIVGALTTYVVHLAMKVPTGYQAVLFPTATAAYYSSIRYAEHRWPKLSWLLGCLPAK